MKLQPRLQKRKVLLATGERQYIDGKLYQVQMSGVEKDVEVWRGLAIHEYVDNETKGIRIWRMTHIASGKAVLRNMYNREEAMKYLMRLNEWRSVEKLKVDWCMTEKQLRGLHYWEEIRGMMRGLQRDIDR